MDNFRKRSGRQSPSVVDGFLAADPRFKNVTPQPGRLRPRVTRKLGGSPKGGPDGFVPNTQKPLSSQVAPANHSSSAQVPPPHAAKLDMQLPEEPGRKRGRRGGKTAHGKGRNWRKILLRSFVAVLVVGVLAGGYMVGRAYFAVGDVFKGGGNAPALGKNVDPAKLNGEGDGRVNILLMGRGGEGHDGADLTDTILVASVDPVNKKASILSIPRDLWVKNPSGGQSKINAVYANAKNAVMAGKKTSDIKNRAEKAGIDAVQTTVTNTVGIPIHYYVLVDFEAFVQAVNTVGGVDIYVDPSDDAGIVRETLWDELTGKNYTLDVKAGNNHFDGQRALMYSRSRHTSTRGDFDRAERQRKMIIALKDKIMSAGTYSNPVKINQLISAFGSHVQSSLSTNELMRVYDIAKEIDSKTINSVGLADPPNNYVTTDFVNGQSIVRPRAGLTDFSEIQNYIRNTLKDGYIQNENANIAVYNGSTIPGLAGKKSTDLKSYGYNITATANAPTQDYPKTILVDLTNGQKKYTKHYLEQRLGVTAVTALPDTKITATGSDFVIILGQDESTRQ